MKKVLIGMSGGIDSTVSAILLKEQGYEVVGVTMKLFDGAEKTIEEAKKVAQFIGVEHIVVDFREEFKNKVIDYFINTYLNAKTPNPCVVCNKYLKFGLMYKLLEKIDADYIATGHYCKTEYSEKYNQVVLKKSDNLKKDQSYFLYNINKNVLDKIIFPLEKYENKEEIREIARKYNIPISEKKDSQEICFIQNNDYINFIKNNTNIDIQKSGTIIDDSGNIRGTHNGIINYTVGQRKGLGIQNETPLFVKEINKQKNAIYVSNKEEVYKDIIETSELNFLVSPQKIDFDNLEVKVRYLAKPAKAKIKILDNNNAIIKFEEKQFAPAPGQSVVFYDNDIVVGGGIIK